MAGIPELQRHRSAPLTTPSKPAGQALSFEGPPTAFMGVPFAPLCDNTPNHSKLGHLKRRAPDPISAAMCSPGVSKLCASTDRIAINSPRTPLSEAVTPPSMESTFPALLGSGHCMMDDDNSCCSTPIALDEDPRDRNLDSPFTSAQEALGGWHISNPESTPAVDPVLAYRSDLCEDNALSRRSTVCSTTDSPLLDPFPKVKRQSSRRMLREPPQAFNSAAPLSIPLSIEIPSALSNSRELAVNTCLSCPKNILQLPTYGAPHLHVEYVPHTPTYLSQDATLDGSTFTRMRKVPSPVRAAAAQKMEELDDGERVPELRFPKLPNMGGMGEGGDEDASPTMRYLSKSPIKPMSPLNLGSLVNDWAPCGRRARNASEPPRESTSAPPVGAGVGAAAGVRLSLCFAQAAGGVACSPFRKKSRAHSPIRLAQQLAATAESDDVEMGGGGEGDDEAIVCAAPPAGLTHGGSFDGWFALECPRTPKHQTPPPNIERTPQRTPHRTPVRSPKRMGGVSLTSGLCPDLHDDIESSPMLRRTISEVSMSPSKVAEAPKKLPTFQDECVLDCVSVKTVQRLCEGGYKELYDRVMVIDCRFDFEYEGGHLRDAGDWLSVHHVPPDRKEHMEELLRLSGDQRGLRINNHRTCVIFHCEFSKHRGPAMMKHVRSIDRLQNQTRWPALYYPELYVMKGGYKEFFHTDGCSTLCLPMAYTPMLAPEFEAECARQMKAQSMRRSKSRSSRAPPTWSP